MFLLFFHDFTDNENIQIVISELGHSKNVELFYLLFLQRCAIDDEYPSNNDTNEESKSESITFGQSNGVNISDVSEITKEENKITTVNQPLMYQKFNTFPFHIVLIA